MSEIKVGDHKTEEELRQIEAEKKFIQAGFKFELGDIDEALMLIRTSLTLCPGNSKYH